MDMRQLIFISFGVKIIIAGFFVTLLWVHYLVSQALFNRTASLDAIRTELNRGVDVDERSTSTYEKLAGLTPLMQAVSWNDLARVQLLLKYKAGVNLHALNEQGDTPLIMAIRTPTYGETEKAKKIEIINLLFKQGALVDYKNNYGDTPFIAALDVSEMDMRKKVVDILIAGGADINAQNRNGNTHLHIAIQRGYAPWIEWLLKNYGTRINLTLINKDGYTVKQLAEKLKYIPMVRAFEAGLESLQKKE